MSAKRARGLKWWLLVLSCTISCLQAPATTIVTNAFGICYDVNSRTFDLREKVRRSAKGLPFENFRIAPSTMEIKLKPETLRRINRYYYYAQGELKAGNSGAMMCLIYRYNGTTYHTYNALLDPLSRGKCSSSPIVAEERLLMLQEWQTPMLSILNNGSCGIIDYGGNAAQSIYAINPDEYVIVWNGLRAMSMRCVLYLNLKTEEVKQLPLMFAYGVWNQFVFGTRFGANGNVEFLLYSLYSGKEILLDGAGGALVQAYALNSNKVILEYADGSQRNWNPITKETVDDAVCRYERCSRAMLCFENEMLTSVLKEDGTALWQGMAHKDALTFIDLDQDLHQQREALLIPKDKQTTLIDFRTGEMFFAENIQHLGLGFFQLMDADGMRWITL